MAEDLQVEQVEESQEQQKQEAPKLSAREEEALSMGWRPLDEWDGDPDDFVTAKEFVQRKSLFDKISAQGKELKATKEAVAKFAEHHSKIEEYTRKQILEELKAKKKEALLDGDADKVIEIDDAISDFKIKETQIKAEETEKKNTPPEQQPEVMDWRKRNDWFEKDQELTDYAITIAQGYRTRYSDKSPVEILNYVEKEVKARYKDKFQNQNRNKPSAVESSTSGKAVNNKEKISLSEDQLKVAKSFVKSGYYKSVDDYAQELKKIGAL